MYTIKGMIGNAFMHLCGIFPLQNKAVFSCFDGKMYGDNPRALYEGMRKHSNIKFIWLMRDKKAEIPGAKVVYAFSLKAAYHLATSKLWVDNSRKRNWIVKRKGQYYVQMWHGDICLKKIEKDAIDALGDEYKSSAIHDSEMADLMISGSKWRTDNFESSFWYTGEILEEGTPKSDVFYKEPAISRRKVEKYYKLNYDTKIALYVPTFRADDSLKAYDLDYQLLLEALRQRWPGRWVLLVRLHPKIQDKSNLIEYSEAILNGSLYANTNELIIASDFLVTDYSACMFAGLEAGKKVVLYASDVAAYMDDRGTYFKFDELPFPLSETNEDLSDVVCKFDEILYQDTILKFKKKIGYFNSKNSSQKVSDYIYKKVWE